MLRCIDNTGMRRTRSCKTKEIGILGEEDAALSSRKSKVRFVTGRQHTSFRYAQHIDSTLAQTMNDSPGYMFIGIITNLAHAANAFNFVCKIDEVCLRRAVAKASSSLMLRSISLR